MLMDSDVELTPSHLIHNEFDFIVKQSSYVLNPNPYHSYGLKLTLTLTKNHVNCTLCNGCNGFYPVPLTVGLISL